MCDQDRSGINATSYALNASPCLRYTPSRRESKSLEKERQPRQRPRSGRKTARTVDLRAKDYNMRHQGVVRGSGSEEEGRV